MKILKVSLVTVLVVIIVALLAAFVLVKNISNGAKPQYEGELALSGLTSPVEVIRDERGIPHIYAENEHDLYMVTGYVMAQERLWQMDLIRRATTGRLSEIFGDDYIDTDLFLRALKMSEKSERVIAETDPEVLETLDAFIDGVNSYIDDAGKKLPPEFRILGYRPEPWSRIYVANIIGYMGWDLASGNLSGDIFTYKLAKEFGEHGAAALIPFFDYDGPTVYPEYGQVELASISADMFINAMSKLQELGLATFSGSNNWAVDGAHSTTGMPILENDMHLALSSPGIWIQMHQVVPGKLNVTGVLVPGEPYVIAGHNENIAWGMTNLKVDDIDLYLETTNEDKTKYLFDGEWKEIIHQKEIIKSKKGVEHEREILYTHHGPIISGFRDIEDADLAMRWAGQDFSNEVESVYKLNRATDWIQFNNALALFNAISQNFVYADVNGNIGLHAGGGVAVRNRHGAFVMPGDTSLYDWQGYVPHEMLPYAYNPDGGSVSSANNKTVGPDYPWYIGTYFAMPYRITRIREMLTEKEKYSTDDFKRMATDRQSDYAKLVVPELVNAFGDQSDLSEKEKEALGHIATWNYNMAQNQVAPTIFEFFVKNLAMVLLKDDLGELYNEMPGSVRDFYLYRVFANGLDLFVDDATTEKSEDLNEMIRIAFSKSIDEISHLRGPAVSGWIWGDIHKFGPEHPMGSVKIIDKLFKLNGKPVGVGGSKYTVSAYSYGPDFKVNHGASERHIFNTADWDESFTVIPTGISGVPSSEYYLNQTETYCNDEFYKDHFSRKAVEAAQKKKLMFIKKTDE